MKYPNSIFILFIVIISLSCDKYPVKQDRVLVFAKTSGFRHSCIPHGKAAILQLGRQNGFEADTTEDASFFTAGNSEKYKAVVFLNTTGDVLNDQQQLASEEYIRGGGGYAGVHAASDTEYGWPWYGKLVGAYFESHPEQQEAILQLKDPSHVSTRHIPAVWKRKDEWYNFKDINSCGERF